MGGGGGETPHAQHGEQSHVEPTSTQPGPHTPQLLPPASPQEGNGVGGGVGSARGRGEGVGAGGSDSSAGGGDSSGGGELS